MDFVFTDFFYGVYQHLNDDRAVAVDEIIKRLLTEHESGWARQGRIEGDRGGAWIITVTGPDFEGALYWDYHTDTKIILVALVVRARLQSFPDRFVFTSDPRRGPLAGRIEGGPGHSRYRQVGNAVPPLLARAIAHALSPIVQQRY